MTPAAAWTAPPTDVGVQVGLVVAAARIPETFAPGLSRRSAVDQGVVTGLATGVHYLLALGAQDALQAVAAEVAGAPVAARWADPATRLRVLTLTADLAAIPVGLALRRWLPSRPGEAMARGWLRQARWRGATTGVAAISLEVSRAALRAVDERLHAGGKVASLPIAVPVGLALAFVVDRRRGLPGDGGGTTGPPSPPVARSVVVAAGVEGGLAGLAYAEHRLAAAAGRRLADVLPGGPQVWRLATHGASLGLLAAGTSTVWTRVMRRIEAGAAADEPVFGGDEDSTWTGPTLSGGPGSLVPWSTLGKEGRRHMLTHVRPAPVPSTAR